MSGASLPQLSTFTLTETVIEGALAPGRRVAVTRKVVMFAGQGTQYRGMGGDDLAAYPELVAQADEALGYSIARLCLEDPDDQLGSTRYTQPAVFVTNALAWRRHRDEGASVGDVYLGHSLGEINALEAAGALDFTSALRLVRARAKAMAEITGGGMLAVLGLAPDVLIEITRQHADLGVSVANLNTPSQTVLAGPRRGLAAIRDVVASAGAAKTVDLPVSGPFHCELMAPAAAALEPVLRSITFGTATAPVVSNVTARPYEGEPATLLIRQITEPVRWAASISALVDEDTEFIEPGGSSTLGSMLRQIRRAVPPAGVSPTAPATGPVASATGLQTDVKRA